MTRVERTSEELREASNHLHYELWMLTSLAAGITSGVAGQGPIANALLEAFVVHVRNAIDFFYAPERLQGDDIVAEDFFSTANGWGQYRPALSPTLSQAKRRAGKEMAHLTYARLKVTPETKPWPFLQIANDVSELVDLFTKYVLPSNLGSEWHYKGRPMLLLR